MSLSELKAMAAEQFGDMVKVVVDVERNLMVAGGELHADEEAYLLEHGSGQRALWGINLYPDLFGDEDWLEADSMINVRPSQGNRSRAIDDPDVMGQVRALVVRLVRSDG